MGKPAILVVEDEAIVAIDICQTIKMLGYEVLDTVPSGEEALSLLDEKLPDLILMDIKLKGEYDGIQTAELMKDKWDIPFIYLSTFSDDYTLSRAKLTGPYGYITKNVEPNALHSTIEMALYQHELKKIAREKEELLSITLKSISDAVIGTDENGHIISWNKGASDIFGYRSEEVLGQSIGLVSPAYIGNYLDEIIDKVLSGENIEPFESPGVTKSGKSISMSYKISPIKNMNGQYNGVSIIGRDISSKRILEQEALQASEAERKRIGRDLHDSLGQQLTGISLQMKALSNQLKKRNLPEESGSLDQISVLVKEAILQTRELAKGLIPVTLQSEGLVEALQETAVRAESIYNAKVVCIADTDIRVLDEVLSTQLYYIAQEAVNNAVKHAKADIIEIILSSDNSGITLQVNDDGSGIIYPEHDKTKGIGLKIMKYRSNIINGRFSVEPCAGRGTSVKCMVPWKRR